MQPILPSDLESALKKIRKGDYQAGLESLGQLITNDPQRIDVFGHRAWLLRGMGRLDEATADYKQLCVLKPDETEPRVLLADCLRLKGDVEEAARLVGEVLAITPMDARALNVLKACQDARGVSLPVEWRVDPANQVPVRPLNPVIEAIEAEPASYPISSYPEVGRFIYSVVRCLRPKLALETGTFIGYSSLCITQGMQDNEMGHLHTFDLFMDRDNYTSPVLGACSNGLDIARGHLEHAGLSHRVTFHKGDSSSEIAAAFGGKVPSVDFAFIDGDHRLRGALKDWQIVDECLVEGGIVLLHDTIPEKCDWLGPRYLLEELGKRASSTYHWVNIPTPEGYGIALIQKKSSSPSPKWAPSIAELLREKLFHSKR